MLCIGSKFTLVVQAYFASTREWLELWKKGFYKRKIYWDRCHLVYSTESFRFRNENVWSFKHIIFSTSYRLWLIRTKAFYRHCIPRSISIKWHHNSKKISIQRFSILDVNQRSFLKICRRLGAGNLHTITFDYRPLLDLWSLGGYAWPALTVMRFYCALFKVRPFQD